MQGPSVLFVQQMSQQCEPQWPVMETLVPSNGRNIIQPYQRDLTHASTITAAKTHKQTNRQNEPDTEGKMACLAFLVWPSLETGVGGAGHWSSRAGMERHG